MSVPFFSVDRYFVRSWPSVWLIKYHVQEQLVCHTSVIE